MNPSGKQRRWVCVYLVHSPGFNGSTLKNSAECASIGISTFPSAGTSNVLPVSSERSRPPRRAALPYGANMAHCRPFPMGLGAGKDAADAPIWNL